MSYIYVVLKYDVYLRHNKKGNGTIKNRII
jgi:hypothetical protein